MPAPPFELPYTLELPQAEIDIWRQHHDLLSASQHICGEVFRLADVSDQFQKEVTDIGGDVYLKTLMKLDERGPALDRRHPRGPELNERADR